MAAYLMLVAVFFVILNLICDLLYFAVDPRLRTKVVGRKSTE
jgi:peptide/nickel transport system permease protein